MSKKITRIELVVLVALALVLITQLMVPPAIGLADNGDFERIMKWGGLHYLTTDPATRYFNYFTRVFQLSAPHAGSYVSSTILFLQVAVWLNKLFYSRDLFDIRFLGAIHIVTLLAAVWLMMSGMRKNNWRLQWSSGLLLFLSLADKGFFAYFNSLYSETTTFLCLLLLIGFVLHLTAEEKMRYWPLVGTGLASILFVIAKVQNAVLGFLLFLFLIRLLRLYKDRKWRKIVGWMSGVLLVFSIAATSFNAFDQINIYQTVFYGVLKDSPTPQADLQELGIRPDYAVLANTNYFTPHKKVDITSPEFQREYYKKINRMKIMMFYLKHPQRFMQKMIATGQSSFVMNFYLGNYEKSDNRGAMAQSNAWTQWTFFLNHVLPKSFWFIAAFSLLFAAAVVKGWRKARREGSRQGLVLYEFFGALELMSITQFVLPVLGDGQADLGKHLFLFNVLFSIMVVTAILWVIRQVMLKWRQSRDESVADAATSEAL